MKKSRLSNLKEIASYYGFDVNDVSNQYPYSERSGITYGIFDRRTNQMTASYHAASPKLYKYFDKFK